MFYFIYLLLLTFCLVILNKYLVLKKYLISDTGDKHQKFTSKINIPLTGGILIYLNFLYLFDQLDNFFILFSSIIFLVGIFSDMKLLKSAKLRLFLQSLFSLIFVYLSEIRINDTRVFLLDQLLTDPFFNNVFVLFCILIVVNGSNFFDGLNTLCIGYYLIISLIIFYLNFNEDILVNNIVILNFISVLLICFILNSFNKIFLGDSGSYFLGFIFAVFLIELYNSNRHISPFSIILMLWYPSFELLFSMIRKKTLSRSPLEPDSNHLHQLLFHCLKKKNTLKISSANLLSANLINAYNLIILLISMNNIANTQIQIILILLNLTIYTVIYFKLFILRYKKI